MKLKQLLLFSMMLIGILACTPQVSQSTLVIPSSLAYMANKADTILNGTVRDTFGYWEQNRIFTGVRVDVLEYVKSADPAKPSVVELKVMGGQVGETRLEIDHAPKFTPGEQVLLFLVRQQDKYIVYGIYYGVCRVITAVDGVSKQVVGPVFNERKVQNIATQQAKLNPLPPGGEKLDSFVQRIRDLVGRK
jgi:hypothetical protein